MANPDANKAIKPLTRSREKALVSQLLRKQDENNKINKDQKASDRFIIQTSAPSGPSLRVKNCKTLNYS